MTTEDEIKQPPNSNVQNRTLRGNGNLRLSCSTSFLGSRCQYCVSPVRLSACARMNVCHFIAAEKEKGKNKFDRQQKLDASGEVVVIYFLQPFSFQNTSL